MNKANNIWDMPFLPPIAKEVSNLSSSSECITNRTIGEWKLFLPDSIADIPSPFDKAQDYDFHKIAADSWLDVLVPSSLTMQGFDIQNNVEYYYKKTVKVSQKAVVDGMRIFVRFEGIYSNSRIWINNKYKTTHIGGFTPFIVEVTDSVRSDYTFDIVVGVTDIEGGAKGIWNPNGEYVSDCSWASYYAHLNIGGILRDVTLFYLPKESFVLSSRINASLTSDYKDGKLDIKLRVVANQSRKIIFKLCDKSGKQVYEKEVALADTNRIKNEIYDQVHKIDYNTLKYAHKKAKQLDEIYSRLFVPFKRCELKGNLYEIELNDTVKDIVAWNAEKPYLYTLKMAVCDETAAYCVYEEKIGFRQIEYAGQNGKDKNKIYVNGNEIKLRGVCRHDVSHLYGRSLTKDDELQEILTFKRNNVNHIRTSHYPASKHYLELCDEYGIYVELENGVCFKGANGYDMRCSAEEIIQTLSETVEFYFNHPSLLIWSIGNESGFEESAGFRYSYNYVKEQDSSRPMIFSYPYTVKTKPLPYDIYSKHYNKVYKFLGCKNMPKLHDEFAHVACYNLEDLSNDNNYRLAWGESIKLGWENIMKDDGALGCAIWGGIDDVFFPPKSITIAHQRHSAAQALGYGEWGAILDAYKREKPEAYLTKKAFSPVRVDSFVFDNNKISFEVKNWFDHTNLKDLTCVIRSIDGKILYEGQFVCDVPPKSEGKVTLPVDTLQCASFDVAFCFDGIEIEREIFEPMGNTTSISLPDGCDIDIAVEDSMIKLSHNGILLARGLYLFVNGKKVTAKSRHIKSEKKDNFDLYIIKENFGAFKNATYRLEKNNDGILNISESNSPLLSAIIGNNWGVAFEIVGEVDSVDWIKNCLYSYYPDDHLERRIGIAYINNKPKNLYGVKSDNAWKDDNYDYFFNNEIESDKLYVSQDFKTTRTDIQQYGVNIANNKLKVLADKDEINCLTTYNKVCDYIDCKCDRIKTSGNWRIIKRNSEKQCIVSRKKGSSISFDFDGIGVKIYGTRSKEQGVIGLSIDGEVIRSVSTRSDICDVLDFMILDTVTDLTDGRHTLTISLEDNKGVRIKGFEIIKSGSQKVQSYLYVSRGKYYSSLAWGNYYGKKLTMRERQEISFKMTSKSE